MTETDSHTAFFTHRTEEQPRSPLAYEVVLLPTRAQVLAYRKQAALAAEGQADALFGVTVSTFDAWVADLWELYGDGRTLVSPTERALALTVAFEQIIAQTPHAFEGLLQTEAQESANNTSSYINDEVGARTQRDGVVKLAARMVRDAAGLAEFTEACAQTYDQPIVQAEKALLAVIARYFLVIDGLGMVEPGDALAQLSVAISQSVKMSVLMEGFPPLTEQQCRFFAACSHIRLKEQSAPGTGGVVRAPDGVGVRFIFPSGRYAEARLLADVIGEVHDEGRVVLACKNPQVIYESLAIELSREGIACALQVSVPFDLTDFGRILKALHRFLYSDVGTRTDLIDVLYAPFLGFSQADVRRRDASLRADRLIDVHEVYAEIRAKSEVLPFLEDFASDPEAYVLVGALEDIIRSTSGMSEAWRYQQQEALRTACDVMKVASRMGLGMDECFAVLAQTSVNVSCASTSQVVATQADVLITNASSASTLAPGSCATVVLCGMDSGNTQVVDREDAADTLLRNLGIIPTDDALSRARRAFVALEYLPTTHLIVERCLYDTAAEPTYPAMVIEEFVDCYRDDPSATDDMDNFYLLPQALQAGIEERGEEHLFENAAVVHGKQQSNVRIVRPDMGSISPEKRSLVVLPRKITYPQPAQEICLSPSQIESYLACPYLWFVQRRLRVESLDEGFGPLQMGDFAHQVLKLFYLSFQERTGLNKVTPSSIDQAKQIMREIIDEQVAHQRMRKASENRLVPCTEIEQREVQELGRRLVDYLDYEALLLPGFHPVFLEREVGVHEVANYAGVRLLGTIDRIDRDEKGRAVIIDYKSSVSKDYDLANSSADLSAVSEAVSLPTKMQTLIYAQVARRVLGLDMVGALYVGYGRNCSVSGAYDARVLETPHLPNMRHSECQYAPADGAPFTHLLDETEASVEQAIKALLSGKVEPAPGGPHACAWCPHTACLLREG